VTVTVGRARLLGLLAGSIRHSYTGRPLTSLTPELVKARMGVKDRATFRGSISGGDEQHTLTRWEVPGLGLRELLVARSKLAELQPDRPATLFDPV
jgi:hypothetical protein